MQGKLLHLEFPKLAATFIHDVIPLEICECIFFGVISTDHKMCFGVGAHIHREDVVFDKTVFHELRHEMICRLDIFIVIEANYTGDWEADHAFLHNCDHHLEVMGAHMLSEANGFVL